MFLCRPISFITSISETRSAKSLSEALSARMTARVITQGKLGTGHGALDSVPRRSGPESLLGCVVLKQSLNFSEPQDHLVWKGTMDHALLS